MEVLLLGKDALCRLMTPDSKEWLLWLTCVGEERGDFGVVDDIGAVFLRASERPTAELSLLSNPPANPLAKELVSKACTHRGAQRDRQICSRVIVLRLVQNRAELDVPGH